MASVLQEDLRDTQACVERLGQGIKALQDQSLWCIDIDEQVFRRIDSPTRATHHYHHQKEMMHVELGFASAASFFLVLV
jgi:ribosomal 50S subunit-associated protein YjgA (DUF615 family)